MNKGNEDLVLLREVILFVRDLANEEIRIPSYNQIHILKARDLVKRLDEQFKKVTEKIQNGNGNSDKGEKRDNE
jgi:hypothetical protein